MRLGAIEKLADPVSGATRKVLTNNVLLLKSPKSPTNLRPILTEPNHFDQSYVLNALTPVAGCQDHSKP